MPDSSDLESPDPELGAVLSVLQARREEILEDWIDRVRRNRAVEAGRALSDPVLLDHVPQIFDAILDRLVLGRSRDEAEQFATIHGFARRTGGYDPLEVVIEFFILRRCLWNFLLNECSKPALVVGAMDLVDGLLDRAVVASLQAHSDPNAQQLRRTSDEEPAG